MEEFGLFQDSLRLKTGSMDAVGGADGDGTTMQKRMKENKQTKNKQTKAI